MTAAIERSKRDLERQTYLSYGLKTITSLEALLLGLALYYLGFGGDGLAGMAKLALYSLSAFVVAYLVNRMALEKGTTQGASGSYASGLIGFLSILFVGTTFFIATAAGLSFENTRLLRHSDYIEHVSVYADARGRESAQTSQLSPVVNGIAKDLEAKAECETASSCVSGRGSGGYGTVSRTLEGLSLRAASLVEEIQQGLSKRVDIQTQVGALTTRMNETLSDESVSLDLRRGQLRQQNGDLHRLLNAQDEAVPLALVTSYAQELRLGISIAKNPEVTETINRFLSGYAGTIESAVAGLEKEELERPAFPEKTGALDTFDYVLKFAPVFMLAFAIDLIFPLALWAYTFSALRKKISDANPKPRKAKRERTDLEKVTELKVMDLDTLDAGPGSLRPTPPNPPRTRTS